MTYPSDMCRCALQMQIIQAHSCKYGVFFWACINVWVCEPMLGVGVATIIVIWNWLIGVSVHKKRKNGLVSGPKHATNIVFHK